MSKIKLWVTDIDGTIMNYDSSYTSEMYDLIKDVQKRGIKFVLATGRMYMGANHAQKKFDLVTPTICYQGAMVRCGDDIMWHMPLSSDMSKEIVTYLKEKNIHTHVYENNTLYIEDDNKRIMHDYCFNRGTKYCVIDDFFKLKFESVSKILAVIEDKDLMIKIKHELQEKYKGILNIVQSAKMYLEITDVKASKGLALEYLKQHWNLSDDEVVASGDQDNDIELLKHAGIRVCVGDNSENLKKIANYHAKSVNSNELVEIIKDLIK